MVRLQMDAKASEGEKGWMIMTLPFTNNQNYQKIKKLYFIIIFQGHQPINPSTHLLSFPPQERVPQFGTR